MVGYAVNIVLTLNTMNGNDLIKETDIQRIAEEGAKIYQTIKVQYDPKENGKFLAIDI